MIFGIINAVCKMKNTTVNSKSNFKIILASHEKKGQNRREKRKRTLMH